MKKIAIITAGLALALSGSVLADTKIGIVDLNKVLRSDKEVSQAEAKLKKDFEPKNQELIAEQKAFQQKVEEYNKDQTSGKIKGDDLKKAQQNLLTLEGKIQEKRANFQKEFMNAQNQSMQKILKKLENAVNTVAAQEKIDIVFTIVELT